jgi:hypothetical protein
LIEILTFTDQENVTFQKNVLKRGRELTTNIASFAAASKDGTAGTETVDNYLLAEYEWIHFHGGLTKGNWYGK